MTGTPSRNAAPHQNVTSSSPPTAGPITMPPMKHDNQMPIAVARWRGSANMLLIRASVDGINVAPAMPSNARVAISISGEVE
jgi:hypothetical protein